MRRTREHQGIIILLYGMHTIILFRDDTDPKIESLRCHWDTQWDRCLSSTSRCLYSQGYSVCITRVMTVVIGWKIEVKRMKPSIAFHVLEKQEMGVSQQCYHCWIENDTYNSGMKDWSGLIPKCSQDAGYWLYTVEAPGHIPVKH